MTNLQKIAAAAAVVSLTLTTGCHSAGTVSRAQLDTLKQIASTCPPDGIGYIADVKSDGSTSSRSDDIEAARLAMVQTLVTKTAVCSGYFKMTVFADSSVDAQILYQGDLKPDGATQIAKLRKVPDMVDTVMQQIRQAYEEKKPKLHNKGSDVIAQFAVAAEDIGQRAAERDVQADVVIATDGFQTGVHFRGLTTADAEKVAGRFQGTLLPHSTKVTVAGIGLVASKDKPDTATVDAAKALLHSYCTKTGAGTCQAVTDYTA